MQTQIMYATEKHILDLYETFQAELKRLEDQGDINNEFGVYTARVAGMKAQVRAYRLLLLGSKPTVVEGARACFELIDQYGEKAAARADLKDHDEAFKIGWQTALDCPFLRSYYARPFKNEVDQPCA